MDQTPAVIPVIIEVRTSKAEGKEIAVVEPVVVPVVAEASIDRKAVAIEGTTTEPLNTSADHRRSDHPGSAHSATPKTTAVTTASAKTTAVTTGKTTAVASATATGHSSRANAKCHNGH
jgi:hypothetical protein